MRRLVFLVALFGLVASACASSADSIEAAAAAPATSEEVAPVTDDAAVATSDVPTPDPVVYETGREALQASEGKPHVLWFWAPN